MHLIMMVKSAHIFRNLTFFSKMHLYAAAAVVDGPSSSPLQSTMVDMHGGATPFWWSPMEFEINEHSDGETLVLYVKCRRSVIMGSDKSVGLLHLPVKAALRRYYSQANNLPADIALTILSKSGKPRGVLYMSYMFGRAAAAPALWPAPSAPPLEDYEEYGRHYCAPAAAAAVPSAQYLTENIMLH